MGLRKPASKECEHKLSLKKHDNLHYIICELCGWIWPKEVAKLFKCEEKDK